MRASRRPLGVLLRFSQEVENQRHLASEQEQGLPESLLLVDDAIQDLAPDSPALVLDVLADTQNCTTESPTRIVGPVGIVISDAGIVSNGYPCNLIVNRGS